MALAVDAKDEHFTVSEGGNQSTSMKSEFKHTITVVVGKRKVHFTVHPDVLCKRSPFFKAACSGDWKEKHEKQIALPKHAPDTFKVYLQWAYFSATDFEVMLQTDEERALKGTAAFHQRQSLCAKLCRLWVLADYLGDSGCKNEVINCLVSENEKQEFHLCFYPLPAQIIYTETAAESPLREWLVDTIAARVEPVGLQFNVEFYPNQLVLEIFQAFADRLGSDGCKENLTAIDAAKYHE